MYTARILQNQLYSDVLAFRQKGGEREPVDTVQSKYKRGGISFAPDIDQNILHISQPKFGARRGGARDN